MKLKNSREAKLQFFYLSKFHPSIPATSKYPEYGLFPHNRPGINKEANPLPLMAAAVDFLIEAVKEEELSEASKTVEQEPCPSPEFGSKSDPHEPQFQFLNISYVAELASLSTAIHSFHSRLNELQDHLGFIHNAIDVRSKRHLSSSNSQQDSHRQPPFVEDTTIALPSNSSTIVATAENVPSSTHVPQTGSEDCGKIDGKESSSLSELEHLCVTMCSRGLRKYIISHLSDLDSLRRELPLALKSAPKPAKLVFDCIGRFYLQGRKAYSKDSPMVTARQASILILELFLLSGAAETENDKKTKMEPSLKVETDLAAIAWRKRIVNESGSCQAADIDAEGLLLFLASFGIPTVFTNDDLRDLLRSSNSKGIFNALRRSHGFFTRIPGMYSNSNQNIHSFHLSFIYK